MNKTILIKKISHNGNPQKINLINKNKKSKEKLFSSFIKLSKV